MEFVDDAIAVLHHDGAELHAAGAEGEKVGRRLVVHRAAVARDRQAHAGDAGEGVITDRQDALAGEADDDALLPAPARGLAEGHGRKTVGQGDPRLHAGMAAKNRRDGRCDRADGGDGGGELE